MQHPRTVQASGARWLLTAGRLAVIGASPQRGNFGATIFRQLTAHGVDAVAIHPAGAPIDGEPTYRTVTAVPGELAGAVVVVPHDQSAEVVRECLARGIPRIWLFRGLGGPGSVSDEAVALCEAAGVDVVAGACPIMGSRQRSP